jgi:hypothetical protein
MTTLHVESGPKFTIEERFMKETPEYPMGSYLLLWNGHPQIATGYFENEHPGHPSSYWHGGPPFVVMEIGEWDFTPSRVLDIDAPTRQRLLLQATNKETPKDTAL